MPNNQGQFQPDPQAIVAIPVEQLRLDTENPRLAGRLTSDSQDDLVGILYSGMAVDEVAFSIAANGFFKAEPLFVILGSNNQYIVVEGNRRFCAVLLLRDSALRKKVGATDLPSISAERHGSLAVLPAIVYPSRESLWTTVGFRHINGVKPWDSFSKAKYIAEVHEVYNIPLEEIADKIGDRNATVIRLYRGFKILQQAEENIDFVKESVRRGRFYFSHLYTATDQREYQQFLGVSSEGSLRSNPVPDDKINNLADIMTWFYGRGNGEGRVVKSQNPDLNTLRIVVGNESAVQSLRSGATLEQAHAVAVGDQNRLRSSLTAARDNLREASVTVSNGYKGESDIHRMMQEVLDLAIAISDEIEQKNRQLAGRRTNRKRSSQG